MSMQCVEPTVIHVTPSKSSISPQRVAGFSGSFSEKAAQISPTVSPSESNSSIATVATRTMSETEPSSPSSFCTPGSGALAGWLFKKHTHTKVMGSQWARRYVFVHEERGLLVVSKKPDKRKPYWHKDNTNFPLADCSIVTEDGVEKNCFVITCNHERLLLRADSATDRDRWVTELRSVQSRPGR